MGGSTILVVEDHALLAHSLATALRAEGHLVHIARLDAEPGLLEQAARSCADVLLLDLDLGPDHDRGESLLARLPAGHMRVLVVTASTDAVRLASALERGAVAVLSKSRPFADLVEAVVAAAEGRPAMTDEARREILAEARRRRAASRERLEPFEHLTPRESQVLAMLVDGVAAEDIADRFVVSTSTVRTQIRGVLTKLRVRSQLAAVAEARRAGWLPGEVGATAQHEPG